MHCTFPIKVLNAPISQGQITKIAANWD